MKWLWKRLFKNEVPEPEEMTEAQQEALFRAIEAKVNAYASMREVMELWPEVRRVSESLEAARREDRFAEALVRSMRAKGK